MNPSTDQPVREMKFRCWDGKRMIYLCDSKNDTSLILNEWGWEAVDHFSGKYKNLVSSWEVDQSVLMQFTGLTDKNGKEIYEGDIINTWAFGTGLIFYWPQMMAFGYADPADPDNNFKWTLLRSPKIDYKLEIIGNKFENPELLKP